MSTQSRRPPERLKLTIRLLPPGLTEEEFKGYIGSEWLTGNGKVDWMEYSPGKVVKNPAKHSKPSVAWLRVIDKSHIASLEDKVRQATFEDAKNSMNDPVLPGPPVLEFALSQKVPSNRKRVDPRMGTIDQDPDFRIFLESLTNPIQKSVVDLEASLNKDDMRVTTTPLIEHIRSKKAAKEAKPSSKVSKDARELGKNKRKGKEPTLLSTSSAEKSKKTAKGDRVAKQAVKVLTRQADAVASDSSTTQTTQKVATTAAASTASAERRRDRAGPLNIAAKIQRDLGIAPASSRRGTKGKPLIDAVGSSENGSSAPKDGAPLQSRRTSNTAATEPQKRERPSRDRRGVRLNATEKEASQQTSRVVTQPTILRKPSTGESTEAPKAPQSSVPTASSTTAVQAASASSSASSTSKFRVFLKHANPSQGITEPLLQIALSSFGSLRSVDIDKRKGIAHADFEDAAGLAAAIKAGKIEVAQGAVQILPFRERATSAATPKPNGGGGRGGHRGGRGPRGRGGLVGGVVAKSTAAE